MLVITVPHTQILWALSSQYAVRAVVAATAATGAATAGAAAGAEAAVVVDSAVATVVGEHCCQACNVYYYRDLRHRCCLPISRPAHSAHRLRFETAARAWLTSGLPPCHPLSSTPARRSSRLSKDKSVLKEKQLFR